MGALILQALKHIAQAELVAVAQRRSHASEWGDLTA
jgi:hypothetical protein